MIDITRPGEVQVLIRDDGKVLWINVDGKCELRISRMEILEVNDQRTISVSDDINYH